MSLPDIEEHWRSTLSQPGPGALSAKSRDACSPEGQPLWFVVPALTPVAEEYVIRIASFWADEVYRVRGLKHPDVHSDNLLMAPVVETATTPLEGSLDKHLALADATAQMRFLTAHIGFGRAAIGVDIIAAGGTKGRLHSHLVVDEYYVVLQGNGTLRMGSHQIRVGSGALIGKPTGPDLTSHILADLGESMTILDIEVWPEPGYQAKDVVHYPDFGEVVLWGGGWSAIAPPDSLIPTSDLGEQHYEEGYWQT